MRKKQFTHKGFKVTMFPESTLSGFNKEISDHRKKHHQKVSYDDNGMGTRMVWDTWCVMPVYKNGDWDGNYKEWLDSRPESMTDFVKIVEWVLGNTSWSDCDEEKFEIGFDAYPHMEDFDVESNEAFDIWSETSLCVGGIVAKVEKAHCE
jgi:hypothetical protein